MQFYILFNALLVVFGSFLTWIEPKIFVVKLIGVQMIDGKIVFALGILSFVICCYELLRRKSKFHWVYGGLGFIIVIIAGLDFISYYQNEYIAGPGIYLAALGGIQLTGSYIVFLSKGSKPSSS